MKYFALDAMTVVAFRGSDRQALLQRLCTQDLRPLQPQSFVESFFTDVKGKALAHGWVIAHPSELWIVVAGDCEAVLLAHFDRYIIREDVQPVGESQRWDWWLVDRKAASFLGMAFQDQQVVPSTELIPNASLFGIDCHAYSDRYFLVASSREQRDPFLAKLRDLSMQEGSAEEREWIRVNSGWPLFGVDFDRQSLPQEVDRDALAISFSKGCYLGQETIARLDALGQVQKKLKRLSVESVDRIAPQTKIFQGELEAGWVTSSAKNPEKMGAILFAFIKRPFLSQASTFNVEGHPAHFTA